MIAAHGLDDVVLIGSSMGGWLMLLVAQALGDKARALVGLAAAPDFTTWGYAAARKPRWLRAKRCGKTIPMAPIPRRPTPRSGPTGRPCCN
jgi:pimeloyl-ACP methyl ester carboxylesterase